MKAVIIRRFGGPEVLEIADVPVPQPEPGQLRIRVKAAAVNPVDAALRGLHTIAVTAPEGRGARPATGRTRVRCPHGAACGRTDPPRLAELVDAGRLTLRVASTHPLEAVAAAHERIATGGLRGRIVLKPTD